MRLQIGDVKLGITVVDCDGQFVETTTEMTQIAGHTGT